MTNDLVSVIIPTYNRAGKISAAIKSVLAQNYKPVQLIVIDDGSTDHTNEVIKHFSGVEYVVQKHTGQAAARNHGLKKAKGDFIATLDSDDTWKPDFLSKLIIKLKKDRLDFVFANWLQKTSNGTDRDYLRTYPRLAPFLEKIKNGWIDLPYTDLRNVYLAGCPSPSSSALIRRSAIVNGWEPDIHIGDDWCLFLDIILKKECKAAFCLENLWVKEIDTNNIYDGRAWNEVSEFLYVKDLKHLLNRYRFLLTPYEINDLEKLYMENILSLAIYKLLKNRRVSQSFKLIKLSFQLGMIRTLKAFPNTFKFCLSQKLKTLSASFANIL